MFLNIFLNFFRKQRHDDKDNEKNEKNGAKTIQNGPKTVRNGPKTLQKRSENEAEVRSLAKPLSQIIAFLRDGWSNEE